MVFLEKQLSPFGWNSQRLFVVPSRLARTTIKASKKTKKDDGKEDAR